MVRRQEAPMRPLAPVRLLGLLVASACSVGGSVVGDATYRPAVDVGERRVPAAIRGRFDAVPDAFRGQNGVRLSLGDCDGDGDLEVAMRSGQVYEQTPEGRLAPREDPIFPVGSEPAVELGDVDGDGTIDALVVGEAIELRPGVGRCRFGAPVVTATRVCRAGFPVVLTPTDVDLDGVRDFWAVCGLPGEGPMVLLRGLGDGRFETSSVGAMSTRNNMAQGLPVFSALSEDLDDDGAVDVALLSDSGTAWFGWGDRGSPASYTLDEPLTDAMNDVSVMGFVTLDFDRDGRLDSFWSGTGEGNRLLWSRGGRSFRQVAAAAGLRDALASDGLTAWSAVAIDVDLDGWVDVLTLRIMGLPNMPAGERPWRPGLYINQHDGTFVDLSERAAPTPMLGKAATCGDLAGDGRVGCVVVEADRVTILRNRVETTGGWLGVRLRGTVSDPEGIGAVVSVEGLARPLVRRVGPGAATWAHHPLGVVFPALGAPAVSLRVRWPSGVEQRVPDVPAGAYTTITEPQVVRVSARVAPADGRTLVDVSASPALAHAAAATIEARGAVRWAGPAALVDGVVHRALVAPSAPGAATLDVTFDGTPLRVHPRVVFR
jgi:hypothetical protein